MTPLPWPHMQAATTGLWTNSVSGRSPELLELFTRLMHFAFRQRGRQLVGLITKNAYRLCADPRDKIYGILGLAHPTITTQIRPNYSLTVADAYKEVFLTYSKFSSRLGMLRGCNLGLRNIDGPSWVPDWSTATNTVIGKRDLILYDTSSACMDYLPPNTLKVAGVHCGVIHHIGSATSSQPREVLEVIRQWEPENLQMASYPTGESMLDAFVVTLRGCHVKERFPDYGYPTTESWKDTYLSKISRRTSSAQIEDAMTDSTVVQTVKNCSYQRFLWTDAGHFGLGPVNAQPGDRICVSLGCDQPMILRPHKSGRFQVVGPCHIRGFEDSAALLGSLPKNWSVKSSLKKGKRPTPWEYHFYNSQTEVTTDQDPRLEPLSSQWEVVDTERPPDKPFASFRNSVTGEVVYGDPRLSPEALKTRGVELKTFELI